MAKELTPAAIVVQAEDSEMDQLAHDAIKALDAGKRAGMTTIERYREAGEFLIKAKKRCKHGNWIAWLNRHNIERTSAFRAIKVALKCCTAATFELEDGLRALSEEGEESEIELAVSKPRVPSDKEDKESPKQSREERLGLNVTPEAPKTKADLHLSPEQEDGPTATEKEMAESNSRIESFCRQLMAIVESLPEDTWLSHRNLRDGAVQKFKDGCSMLRTAKCSALCPKCAGEGCRHCLSTGRVPKATLEQLS